MSDVGLRAKTPGVASAGPEPVGDRLAMVIRIDSSTRRGALTAADGSLMADAATYARTEQIPLIGYITSSGADANEGVAALHGWGTAARAFAACSGVVPMLFAIDGPAVSGSALLLGLGDLVVMTTGAYAFVSGPIPVRTMTGVRVGVDDLGGALVHHRETGAAALLVNDTAEAEDAIAELVSYLPDCADGDLPIVATSDPTSRAVPEVAEIIPAESTGSYDVRDVARTIVDDDILVELRPGWAPNIVTALASIGGRPVGVIANQPTRWQAHSTSLRRRRAHGSLRSAMRSEFRS